MVEDDGAWTMIAFALAVWRNKTLIALAGLCIIAGLLWVQNGSLKNAVTERDNALTVANESIEAAVSANKSLAADLAAAETGNAKMLSALQAEIANREVRVERIEVVKMEIYRAPETDDGPVAPVLARAIAGLR
jgi:cytoskeletal protein RodZ